MYQHKKYTVKLLEIFFQVKKMFIDDKIFIYRMNILCQTIIYYLTLKNC